MISQKSLQLNELSYMPKARPTPHFFSGVDSFLARSRAALYFGRISSMSLGKGCTSMVQPEVMVVPGQ